MKQISVNGNWGAFGNYGICTKPCGGGTQTRYRVCNRPAPAHGGKACAGSSSSWRTCNTHACKGDKFQFSLQYFKPRTNFGSLTFISLIHISDNA